MGLNKDFRGRGKYYPVGLTAASLLLTPLKHLSSPMLRCSVGYSSSRI